MLKTLLKILSFPFYAAGFVTRLIYIPFDFGGEQGQLWITRIYLGKDEVARIEKMVAALKGIRDLRAVTGPQIKPVKPLDIN